MSLIASESVLSRWAALGELSTALAQGAACLEAQGLWGSSRALVVSALVRDTGRPVLYLSPGTAERHRAAEDIRFFRDTLDSPSVPVLEFPPAEPSSWQGRHRDHGAQRGPAGPSPPGDPSAPGLARCRGGGASSGRDFSARSRRPATSGWTPWSRWDSG